MMESSPQLSSPEEELEFLRAQVLRKEQELAEKVPERGHIVAEQIQMHHAAPVEVLAPSYQVNEATQGTESDALRA